MTYLEEAFGVGYNGCVYLINEKNILIAGYDGMIKYFDVKDPSKITLISENDYGIEFLEPMTMEVTKS